MVGWDTSGDGNGRFGRVRASAWRRGEMDRGEG
jgi:hypothetical protein